MADVSVTLQPGQEYPVSVTDQLTASSATAPLTNINVAVASVSGINATVAGASQQIVTLQTGVPGATGATPVLSVNSLIGNVANGQPGIATITGSSLYPVLNLTLPAGPSGPQGIQGNTGATGAIGATGPAGPTGLGYDGITSSNNLTNGGSVTITVNKIGALVYGSPVRLIKQSNYNTWYDCIISAISGNNITLVCKNNFAGTSVFYSQTNGPFNLSITGSPGSQGPAGSSPGTSQIVALAIALA